MGIVTLTILLPLLGALGIGLFSDDDRIAKGLAVIASATTLVAAIVTWVQYDPTVPGIQLVDRFEWIPPIGSELAVGVDGISLLLILLTAVITLAVVVVSLDKTDRVRGYLAAFLLLEGAVIGVFSATDLLLFYVFFEFTLVPMYLIIGMWGGANRRYAAVKFFLYTFLGGLLMLAAILWIYAQTPATASATHSFAYDAFRQVPLTLTEQRWLFGAFFVAFAVKMPLFPVHTWLPDAHTEAPTAGSVFLAAVLLKMGGYGFLRFSLPLFPDASTELALGTGTGFFDVPWLLVLSVIGILYGALVALMQRDIKKLIAYSSVSHMGFVVLGIFALNVTAASAGVVQMVNHGLSTGALFLLIGFLYDRRHTRQIAAFGGLARQVPVMAGLWLVVSLSSLALPGLNGFVGEFPILLGAFQTHRGLAAAAAFGAVLAALYLLWPYQRMFHGPLEGADNENTRDLRRLEVGVMVPLVALIVVIGVYPKPLYDTVVPAVDEVMSSLTAVQPASAEVVPATEPAGASR
jgi:NADH-quinone oxidoreductase subunit M